MFVGSKNDMDHISHEEWLKQQGAVNQTTKAKSQFKKGDIVGHNHMRQLKGKVLRSVDDDNYLYERYGYTALEILWDVRVTPCMHFSCDIYLWEGEDE